jgi:hypothetical protein
MISKKVIRNIDKKILIVSPYYPYPANFGGTVDILRRIQLLKKNGYSITLIATVKVSPLVDEIEYVKQFVDDVIIIKRKKAFISIMSFSPFQVSSRSKLKKCGLSEEYEYLIMESEYVANILRNKSLNAKKIVLRMHNNESKYNFELFKSSYPSIISLHYLIESVKFKFFSDSVYKKVNRIACISEFECKSLQLNSYNNAFFSPTVIDITSFKNRRLENKCVIYVGALFMPNNIEGLSWYIKNVHGYLKKYSDYRFIIIGSTHGSKNEYRIHQLCNNDSQIDFFFNVENLDYYYNQSSIFINPMLNGAGVKIKSINAIIEGLPLVTTKKGIEGTGLKDHEHVLIADDALHFKENIELLFSDANLGVNLTNNAQKFLLQNYSESYILSTFLF